MRIFVVSFSPSKDSRNGVGGFDWYYEREPALGKLAIHLADAGYNLALVEVVLPKNVTKARGAADEGKRGHAITEWLDANAEIYEPRGE